MKTVRLTMAQALVRWLTAQQIEVEGERQQLFAGVFAIFGHGNVTCLGEALAPHRDKLPVWRGQNEQSMALAAIAYAKAKKRRQIMIASSSIGPGATNMVTAAGVAHSNRLPVLFLSGDIFLTRTPDPVLQQVEHFGNPTVTVSDAFRAVTRFWDRITHPAQLMVALPQATATMLDPGDCGPAFIGLPQDIQGYAYDYPEVFFEPRVHRVPRPRPDVEQLVRAAEVVKAAKKPLIIAGGGVHYSLATAELAAFAERHAIPVAETIAGRAVLTHAHANNIGPIGVIGSTSANALAAETDVVLAVGTRLQDFTTGSWSAFASPDLRVVALNAARYDAHKHRAVAVVGDAQVALSELSAALGDWKAPASWLQKGKAEYKTWNEYLDRVGGPTNAELPTYGHVVGAVNRKTDATSLVVTAAGGLPGELTKAWKAKSVGSFDCEFGFSCMGYEVAGGWGTKMAVPERDVIVMVGDGSYLMMNSDIYSSVLTGHKLTVIICDNGGYAVIDRLQQFKGSPSYNNLIENSNIKHLVGVDFAKHAESLGARAETVVSIADFEAAFERARKSDRTYVIVIKVHQREWTGGDAWWETGVPEVSTREEVRKAYAMHAENAKKQRVGV